MNNKIRTIKKYRNRSLYDTETSSYITLETIKELVMSHVEFQVIDSQGNDVTTTILLQVINEQETRHNPIFTKAMLQSLIRFYGQAEQPFVSQYLENGLEYFVSQQDKLQNWFPDNQVWQSWTELGQKSLAMWQESLQLFKQGWHTSSQGNTDYQADVDNRHTEKAEYQDMPEDNEQVSEDSQPKRSSSSKQATQEQVVSDVEAEQPLE